MANPVKGEVVLADASAAAPPGGWTLVLGLNQLCEAEALTGKVTGELLLGFARRSLIVQRALLWAALQTHHAPVTVEAAGELMQRIGVPALYDKLKELLELTFPEKKDDAEAGDDRPPAAAGTGSAS